jgi:drug/metabolite transporter (DMT)-like permease
MSSQLHASRAAVVSALLLLYFLWGATYLGMKWSVEAIPPFLMSSVRFFVAGLIMYVALRLGGAAKPTGRDWLHAGLIGLFLMVGGNGGVAYAEQYVSSGFAALLVSTVPLWIILMAWLTGTGPRPTSWIMAGLVVGFLGMYFLVGPGLHWQSAFSGHGRRGVAATFVAALAWSVGSLYARHIHLSVSAFLGVAMQMMLASVVLFMVACSTGETATVDWHLLTARSVGAFIFLLVAAPVGFTAYLWLLKVCAPSIVTTYAFVNPVIAMGLGWMLAGETVTSAMLIGAALLVAGVAMVVLGQPAKTPAKELTEEQVPL